MITEYTTEQLWAEIKRRESEAKCPVCGSDFVRQRGAQKYCSPECAHKKKLERALVYWNTEGKQKRENGDYCIKGRRNKQP